MELVDKKYVEGCVCDKLSIFEIQAVEKNIIPDMIKIMGRGIGLAAPQVGINKRFFIMKYRGEIISCYNPEIIFSSKQKKALKEGCLTYPQGIHGTVNIMRPCTIGVKFLDKDSNIKEWRLRGLESKCFQHELDHLNGITIFNRNGVNHG
jgi:peptide deformylase